MMSALKQQLQDSLNMEMAAEALRDAKSVPELTFAWMVHCEDQRGKARENLRQIYKERFFVVSGAFCP